MWSDAASKLTASMLRDLQSGGRTEGAHVVGDMLQRVRAAGLEPGALAPRGATCRWPRRGVPARRQVEAMSQLKVTAFAMSIDGYGAGPDQSLENPLGVGGMALHEWMLRTRTFQQMHGGQGGDTGVDDDCARRSFDDIGAWILGRNMFGPVRGPWPDDTWRGWWGDEPPYHVPVFVLTHHARPSLAMEGGTTFHFVTGGIDAGAAARARGRRRQGRAHRRRRRHGAAVPAGRAGRRDASGAVAGAAGPRRGAAGRAST